MKFIVLADYDNKNREIVDKAIRLALESSSPNSTIFDTLYNSKYVQEMKSENGFLYQAFELFVFKDFKDWAQVSEKYIKELNLNKEKCDQKLKYLTICSIAH